MTGMTTSLAGRTLTLAEGNLLVFRHATTAITRRRRGSCHDKERTMRNLELKVSCDAETFAAVQRAARALGPSSVINQRDTYFAVPSGRLKLREIDDGVSQRAELIGYSRPDVAGARWSQYYRAEFSHGEIAPLTAMMERTIGVRIVVSKV